MVGGGLMQLIAYGAMDVYLTGNPQITFFKVKSDDNVISGEFYENQKDINIWFDIRNLTIEIDFNNEICPICRDQFQDDSMISICKNNHLYHKECFIGYQEQLNEHSCPYCKYDMVVNGDICETNAIKN